ncbi:DUF1007 family protein [Reyranella sp.]|jgi:ABC-type uncharacterized transport system substrate-binding protein|uniref:DUF1007 family protein n=1 Tax=Reyranella sp. TaxID=1929291 RepID=UPI002F9324D5
MRPAALLLVLATFLAPAVASAHPHIWLLQRVKPVVDEGNYTELELEWRFDPASSENEIAVIDENKDGTIAPAEVRRLTADTLQALEQAGFMTWLNTGGKDFRLNKAERFDARVEDPATFTPPDWDRSAGDKEAAMSGSEPPKASGKPRNLVYVIRVALPRPVKTLTITTYDPEDFIRVEVDKSKLPAGCTPGKHPTYKSEFVPGHPILADMVSCKLP